MPSIKRDGVCQVCQVSSSPSPDLAPFGRQWVYRVAHGRVAADFENGAHGAAFRRQLHSSDDHGESTNVSSPGSSLFICVPMIFFPVQRTQGL